VPGYGTRAGGCCGIGMHIGICKHSWKVANLVKILIILMLEINMSCDARSVTRGMRGLAPSEVVVEEPVLPCCTLVRDIFYCGLSSENVRTFIQERLILTRPPVDGFLLAALVLPS
jgi:hypothetical protein